MQGQLFIRCTYSRHSEKSRIGTKETAREKHSRGWKHSRSENSLKNFRVILLDRKTRQINCRSWSRGKSSLRNVPGNDVGVVPVSKKKKKNWTEDQAPGRVSHDGNWKSKPALRWSPGKKFQIALLCNEASRMQNSLALRSGNTFTQEYPGYSIEEQYPGYIFWHAFVVFFNNIGNCNENIFATIEFSKEILSIYYLRQNWINTALTLDLIGSLILCMYITYNIYFLH